MPPIQLSEDQTSRLPSTDDRLPVAQARRRPLEPMTAWEYPSEATFRFLSRQQHRVQTTLNLDAVIVQDERGLVALWAGEPP